jgi:hypothetical protein
VANYEDGSISVLRDSVPGVEESYKPQAPSSRPLPTIIRGVLMMGDRGRKTEDRAEFVDVSGRKVMDLHAGANDVRGLVPGVYFVCDEGQGTKDETTGRVRKVVVQR